MHSIFPAPWGELQLADVGEFLAEAGEEGLTWEAKGERNGQAVTTKSIGEEVCGLANSVGGYLILGAVQSTKGAAWSLTGLTVPEPEPRAWLSRVICDRLRPIPRFDIHAWAVAGDRSVMVVEVQPVAVPPCLTVDGLAFERVTGQTKKVDNPGRLADLLLRGDKAKLDSEHKSRAAVSLIDTARPLGDDPGARTRIAIGLAATGYAPDIGSRLFSRRFMERLDENVLSVIHGLGSPIDVVGVRRTRSHTHATVELAADVPGPTMPQDQRVGVVASWDGSVSFVWDSTTTDISTGFGADEVCRLALSCADALVVELGGYGEGHLAIRVSSTAVIRPHNLVPFVEPIERKVSVGEPESLDLAGLQREMLRASGLVTFEPS